MSIARIAVLSTVFAVACTTTGRDGEPGSPGPAGALGPVGPQGEKGEKGDKGDPGAVLTVDGGVLVGPPGAPGVPATVTALPLGDAACPFGGVLVSVDGGGRAVACNGVPGDQGPAGATGPRGVAGEGVIVTPLDAGTACAAGGVRVVQQSDGGVLTVCNGSAGPPGPAGAVGPVGPQGPPGVLTEPRGQFAGFTPATYTGNLGGRVGAHAICAAVFPNSVMCDDEEYIQSTSPVPVPAGGAWMDDWERLDPGERNTSGPCGGWTNGVGLTLSAFYLNDSGYADVGSVCHTMKPVACCFTARPRRFRGFTPTRHTGNLGGRFGAHALCAGAFAGSHLCDENEYVSAASPTPVPSGGAWIDNWESNNAGGRSFVSTCLGWTNAQSNSTNGGLYVNDSGYVSNSYVTATNSGCQTTRPLACCD